MARYLSSKRKNIKSVGTMDVALIIVCISAVVFTAVMIYLFLRVGSIPDTLCTCVFAILGGECGILGWIKTNKDKIQDRKWDLEDKDKEIALMKNVEEVSNV